MTAALKSLEVGEAPALLGDIHSVLSAGAGRDSDEMILALRKAFVSSPSSMASLSTNPRSVSKSDQIIVPARSTQAKNLGEVLFDTVAALKIKTAEVAMHLDPEWREMLFRQLDFIHAVEDWDEADRPTQLGSYMTFLRMVLHIRPSRRPGLGLTSEGNVAAMWTVGRDRLTIDCLPGDEVRWVLIRYIRDKRETAAGKCVLSRLLEVLVPYQPDVWFRDEAQVAI